MNPEAPEITYCRTTIKAWEKLRIIYNGIMLVAGGIVLWRAISLQNWIVAHDMATGGPAHVYPIAPVPVLVMAALGFGLIANLCFCLGPYSEFLLAARGVPLTGERIRKFVFAMGVLLSLGLVGLAWAAVELIADFNALAVP